MLSWFLLRTLCVFPSFPLNLHSISVVISLSRLFLRASAHNSYREDLAPMMDISMDKMMQEREKTASLDQAIEIVVKNNGPIQQ